MCSDSGSGSVNDSTAPMDEDTAHVVISDDEGEGEEISAAAKRKLTSVVWQEMKKIKVGGEWKAKCIYCYKKLSARSSDGTTHLRQHLRLLLHCNHYSSSTQEIL